MASTADITKAFIKKRYLVPKGPADILLYPHHLTKFLKKHGLLKYFVKQEKLKTAVFKDAYPAADGSMSCTIEFPEGKYIQSAAIHVMFDSFFREEHLCPIRIAYTNGRYELILAPMSGHNIDQLDHFYKVYRINIAQAYRIRHDVLNRPFKSGDLPDCLAAMFIDQNAVFDENDSRGAGITVSEEQFNPDATIMNVPAEELMRLYKKD